MPRCDASLGKEEELTRRGERNRFAILRACCLGAGAILLAGCGGEHVPSGEGAAARPASVSAAQFSSLAWLSGRWRGVDATGAPFFEAYVPQTPSTIRTYSYADSTFVAPNDSGLLQLRGDTLFSGSPSVHWVATHLDSIRVEFAPWRGASNRFVWLRTAPGGWTATLQWDSAGTPQQRVYEMRAVR